MLRHAVMKGASWRGILPRETLSVSPIVAELMHLPFSVWVFSPSKWDFLICLNEAHPKGCNFSTLSSAATLPYSINFSQCFDVAGTQHVRWIKFDGWDQTRGISSAFIEPLFCKNLTPQEHPLSHLLADSLWWLKSAISAARTLADGPRLLQLL